MGFRQEYVEYEKQPRTAGASGWTLARKIELVIDSVTAFPTRRCDGAPIWAAAMLAVALVLTVAGVRLLPELGGGLLLVLALLFGLSGADAGAGDRRRVRMERAGGGAARPQSSSKPPRRTTCRR